MLRNAGDKDPDGLNPMSVPLNLATAPAKESHFPSKIRDCRLLVIFGFESSDSVPSHRYIIVSSLRYLVFSRFCLLNLLSISWFLATMAVLFSFLVFELNSCLPRPLY